MSKNISKLERSWCPSLEWAPILCCAALCGATACTPIPTITVNVTSDDGEGSLRAAIDQANRETGASVLIQLPSGTYSLSRCAADDANVGGDLDITRDGQTTIEATGPNVIINQTCAGERVLHALGSGKLSLIGVTVAGGSLVASDPSIAARGGGIRTDGDLHLARSVIKNNSSTGAPGARGEGAAGEAGGAALGGGVFVGGSLEAIESWIIDNTASGGPGGSITAAGQAASAGGSAEGGGAYVAGSVAFTTGHIERNQAKGGKGGDVDPPDGRTASGDGGSARGGGLAQAATSVAAFSVTRTAVGSNAAVGGDAGGAIATFEHFPTGSTSGAAAGSAFGGALASAGTLDVKNVTAVSNRAAGGSTPTCLACAPGASFGGAVAAVRAGSVSNSDFRSNSCTSGTVGECFCSPNLPVCCSGAACQEWDRAAFCARCGSSEYCRYTFGCPSLPLPIPDPNTIEVCGRGVRSQPASGGAVWGGGELQLTGGSYLANAATRGAPGYEVVEPESGAVAAVADLRAEAVTVEGNRGVGLSTRTALSVKNSWIHANDQGLYGTSVETDGVVVNDHQEWGVWGSTVTLLDTAILGNSIARTTDRGGSGGVWAGTLSATNTTIAQNDGVPFQASTAALVNTTVVGISGEDGSLNPLNVHSLELDHATLVGVTLWAQQLTTARSVVIAAPEASVCPGADGSWTIAVSSNGYNWFSDNSCGLRGTGDRQGAAAFALGSLARNGGDVPTMLPGPGSVLIDRIPARACTLASDARGVTRPQGSGCDIGAVEVTAP